MPAIFNQNKKERKVKVHLFSKGAGHHIGEFIITENQALFIDIVV